MINKNVCKNNARALKMARESARITAEYEETQLRTEKREGLKAFRFKKLISIVYANIKNRMIYMANNDKNNYNLDDIMEFMQDKESKIYKQIYESVIERTKMMANQYDEIALARAKKNSEPIENVKLINKNKINLEPTIKHMLGDKYGLVSKAIEDFRKEKEELKLKKTNNEAPNDPGDNR